MSYKGGDLDLRTPLGLTGSPSSSGSSANPSGNGKLSAVARADRAAPIWVDETVMSCCNLAFELASAHRADRVRIEHLVHALTLTERAAEALERRGVDGHGLRRDTGALITGTAVLLTTDKAPVRSQELEQVLQIASQHAYPLRRPVAVADLINVLRESPAHWPGVEILVRHMRDVTASAKPSRRERVRVQAVSQPAKEGSQAVSAKPRGGSSRPEKSEPEAQDRDYHASGLGSAIHERAAIDPSDSSHDGSLVLLEPRAEEHYQLLMRAESIRAVEALENKFAHIEQGLSTVLERITGFERDLRGRLDEDNSKFDAIAAHLSAFEEALTEPGDRTESTALVPHVSAIAAQTGEISVAIEAVRSRLVAIETAAQAQNSGNERLQAVVESLSATLAIERKSVIKAVTEPIERGMAAVNATLIEQHIEDRDALRQIGGRLARTEDGIATLGQQVTEASERFQQRHAESLRSVGQIGERLAQTEAGLADIVQQIMKAAERLQLQRQSADNAGMVQIGERLTQTEAGLTKLGQRMVTQAEAGLNLLGRQILDSGSRLERELDQVHDGLSKVNGNQQAIASNMDQWRENTLADLGTIGDRLEALERSSFRTSQVVEALALSVQDLHEIAAKAEERRTRLSRWLFGPDETGGIIWRPLALQSERPREHDEPEDGEAGLRPLLNKALSAVRNAIRSK